MMIIIALLLVFILLLGGALCYFLLWQPAQHTQVRGGQREAKALQGSLNVMTEDEIQEALNNIVEEGMFRISIASNIIAVEDGLAQVRIENNLQNRYVMQVTLYLDETGEEIYRTDLIDPGYYIQETEFDKHLDPGEYAATAVFTALYADTEEVVGTVGAHVTIHVFAQDQTPTPAPTESPAPTGDVQQ
ncbi:MAG: hypothetical protein E7316_01355 [Clostridiales bacterium]|nr:hypothetical protein [Clostridiales bacterium]